MNNYMNTCLSYVYYIIYYHKLKYNYHYIQIMNSNLLIKDISNLRIKTVNLKVRLKYTLANKLNVIQKLIAEYKQKQLISIYSYSYKSIYMNTNQYLCKISKLVNLKELYLLSMLKYFKFQYSNLANNFIIYLNFLFHYDTTITECINFTINSCPYITLRYNRIFSLPLTLPNIYKHNIQFDMAANIFDITKDLTTTKSFNEMDEHYDKKNQYDTNLINKTTYLFHTKYKIYPNKYFSIYLLINYTKNISHQIFYLVDIYKSKLIYKNYYQIGIGINFYNPFKYIPIVFIEYFINNKYENIFYIGTNFS
uniref:Uncharacterized protein n=1 Tax=Gracilaria firma TaxID=2510791 RepID=A0A1P8D6I2_9FLOR|nr:hypothetical protein [Gracilaria firma]APR74410.1 hypothetical protein [Gracilaria firma]